MRGELVGVLCLESEIPYRFHEDDKATIELLGSYLAIAIQNMQWQERSADVTPEPSSSPEPAPIAAAPPSSRAAAHEVIFYAGDECVLLDGEYLVRGLPARILWRLMRLAPSLFLRLSTAMADRPTPASMSPTERVADARASSRRRGPA